MSFQGIGFAEDIKKTIFEFFVEVTINLTVSVTMFRSVWLSDNKSYTINSWINKVVLDQKSFQKTSHFITSFIMLWPIKIGASTSIRQMSTMTCRTVISIIVVIVIIIVVVTIVVIVIFLKILIY